MGSSATLPMLPHPAPRMTAIRQKRCPKQAHPETVGMRFWLRAGVRIGCDLGRERGVPEMFWGRFGAQLGTKLTISGAVDFALRTMQSSADAGGCSDLFRSMFAWQ